jgi:probable FeS assembly SUF system protein SufT
MTTIQLTRDCPAVKIPDGHSVTLQQGTAVDITQKLGGTYTVLTPLGLFRIAGRDADALGEALVADDGAQASQPPGASPAASAPLSEQVVWDILRTCYDPEIPVNIVDLGLVYEMSMQALPSGNQRVDVKMTLTAPGCGMGGVIAGDAQQKLLMLDGVEEATVEIIWDPPWHQSRITAEGRRILGLE